MSKWIKSLNKCNNPDLRLFLFPYGGGAASVFNSWSQFIPENIDLVAIQLPGREERFHEDAISDMVDIVDYLFSEIRPFLDVGQVFFGHSIGASIAFELARRMQNAQVGNLHHIILSARLAPHVKSAKENLHLLPKHDLIKELQMLSEKPPVELLNSEIMDVFIPTIRADFALSEYSFDRHILMQCNASLFGGKGDSDVPFAGIKEWKKYVGGVCEAVEFNGKHLFINEDTQNVITKVNLILKKYC